MDLLTTLEAALAAAAQSRAPLPPAPPNSRAYACSHPGCARVAYAAKLCNGHYLRKRSGADMDKPFKHTLRRNVCSECASPIGGKGGWGLCQKHYRAARTATVKRVLIDSKGGRCAHCDGVFHPAAFDFHHTGPKEGAVSEMIANASVAALAREAADCVLLCANCHRVHHADERDDALREVSR